MSRIRQIMVASGTFSVALGIGFVMQNGDALAARFSDTSPAPVVAPAGSAPMRAASATPSVVADALAPRVPEPAPAVRTLAVDNVPATDAPVDIDPPLQLAAVETDLPPALPDMPLLAAPACTARLDATVMPVAMVNLALSAPCSPDTRVTIHHQGMMFSLFTDAAGLARVNVPALAESAVFLADLGTGEGAVAVATVPDLARYDRAVLQWQGLDGPEIHALEFGAGYGEEGHVWHGAARSALAAVDGSGGFLVRLGDPAGLNPLLAEVYTYPSGASLREGRVDLTVETPVTANNCGRDIAAQTIQVSPGADPITLDLALTVPDCDALGEYLVLNQMLFDLTLAAR